MERGFSRFLYICVDEHNKRNKLGCRANRRRKASTCLSRSACEQVADQGETGSIGGSDRTPCWTDWPRTDFRESLRSRAERRRSRTPKGGSISGTLRLKFGPVNRNSRLGGIIWCSRFVDRLNTRKSLGLRTTRSLLTSTSTGLSKLQSSAYRNPRTPRT